MNPDASLIINRTDPRHCLRVLAPLVLVLALAGCGRDDPKPTIIGQALAPEPTLPAPSTTTTLPPEPSTTTTAPPRRAVTRLADPTPESTVKPRTPPTTAAAPSPTTTTIAAPGSGTLTSHGGPVRDHVSLVDNLRGRGLTVTPVDRVQQPFLRADGTILAVSGAGIGSGVRLQSFDYATADAAAADAATFGPDGNPRGSIVEWMAPPHLYLRGRVLVIYVGSDAAMTGVLTDLLGPQFAGR